MQLGTVAGGTTFSTGSSRSLVRFSQAGIVLNQVGFVTDQATVQVGNVRPRGKK